VEPQGGTDYQLGRPLQFRQADGTTYDMTLHSGSEADIEFNSPRLSDDYGTSNRGDTPRFGMEIFSEQATTAALSPSPGGGSSSLLGSDGRI